MVKAVAATAIRSDHIVIVKQPDFQKVIVQCQSCGESRTHQLPSGIPAFVQFAKKMETDHKACAPSS